jgi:molybdopterin molybdotransferase
LDYAVLEAKCLVKLKGFQKLANTDAALQSWFNAWQVKKPKQVTLGLDDAFGRVLALDVVAIEDLPRFDKSAMDGYAVRFEDLVGASQFKPVTLQLTEDSRVQVKQAKQVWTGNPIPKGANAVVMLENTNRRNCELEVWSQVAPGDNISRQGGDVKKVKLWLKLAHA